jgi:hypothetical protein
MSCVARPGYIPQGFPPLPALSAKSWKNVSRQARGLFPLFATETACQRGTFPLFGFLIAWYYNTSTAAWVYLAMHGSYGLVWIIKDLAFPDPTWQHRVTIGPLFFRA